MEEDWVPIQDHPEYLVSRTGEVFSIRLERLLKQSVGSQGYLRVYLSVDGRPKDFPVHRLVAVAFIPGWFEGAFVNHKDGVKTNNHYTNLEWTTSAENTAHAFAMGLAHGNREIWRSDVGD